MVFRVLFNICFYKVGCRKLFPVEYGVRGVHLQKEGRKWSHYVIKISVEIEATFINHTFQDTYYTFLTNRPNTQRSRKVGMETENIL